MCFQRTITVNKCCINLPKNVLRLCENISHLFCWRWNQLKSREWWKVWREAVMVDAFFYFNTSLILEEKSQGLGRWNNFQAGGDTVHKYTFTHGKICLWECDTSCDTCSCFTVFRSQHSLLTQNMQTSVLYVKEIIILFTSWFIKMKTNVSHSSVYHLKSVSDHVRHVLIKPAVFGYKRHWTLHCSPLISLPVHLHTT